MSIKEDIERLDAKLAQLKVAYEQYFMRLVKREPVKLRGEVEKLVLNYSNKSITNTSLKFKYNSLVSKYNSYKQYWGRTLRAIEEGTFWRNAEGAGGRAVPPPPVERPARPVSTKKTARAVETEDPVRQVYERYMEARRANNEPTEGITYEKISSTISKYKKQVEEKYNVKDVDLKVDVKDGKTHLKITPKGK